MLAAFMERITRQPDAEARELRPAVLRTIADGYPGEVTIAQVENPRVEAYDHYYNVVHTSLENLVLLCGHHHRLMASWHICFCASLPRLKVSRISKPCRW